MSLTENIFEELINCHKIDYIEDIISPITPYFICKHFIGTEIHKNKPKYIDFQINVKANDLLKNNNYSQISDLDIILVQVDYFYFFIKNILPIIKKMNIRIILITSQYNMPQIFRNSITDMCLNDDNIFLWISQNPIYSNNNKYMAFPYGINFKNINKYMSYIKNKNIEKKTKILNLHSSVHGHLPAEHIRKKYEIFGSKSGIRKTYLDYLYYISCSEFLISTSGDRDDCYRHYECIGLYTIPISNIKYTEIFENNMVYSNAEEMIKMLQCNKVVVEYKKPNRDLLTTKYWLKLVNERINLLTSINK